MLPPFIIDQIRRREEDERRREQPQLELPVDAYAPRQPIPESREDGEDVTERGVVIVDLMA